MTSHNTRPYPYADGDFTVIGPECFTDALETVIAWKGRNYVLEDGPGHVTLKAPPTEEVAAADAALNRQLAVAFDEGARSGKSRAMRYMSDEPGLSLEVENPYRVPPRTESFEA